MGNYTEIKIFKNKKEMIFQIELGRGATFSVQDYEDFAKGVLSAKKMIGSFEIEVSDDYSEDSSELRIEKLSKVTFESGLEIFVSDTQCLTVCSFEFDRSQFWQGYFYGQNDYKLCATAVHKVSKVEGVDDLVFVGRELVFVHGELSQKITDTYVGEEVIKVVGENVFTKEGVATNPKSLTICKGDKIDVLSGDVCDVHNERAQKIKLLQQLVLQIKRDESNLILKKDQKTQLEKELEL